MPPTVYIINESTMLSDVEALDIVTACQLQVSRDFAPVWGTDAILAFTPSTSAPSATSVRAAEAEDDSERKHHHPMPPPVPAPTPTPAPAPTPGTIPQGPADPSAWWLVLLDNSDMAGALGYHDVTPAGLPIGKVFVQDDLSAGSKVSVTVSHELLEMLGDPDINLMAYDPNANPLEVMYAHEMCDACEDDSLGYDVALPNGKAVAVSDFVFPSWFQPSMARVAGTKFDFTGALRGPFQLAPGGYIGVFNVQTGQWSQVNARLSAKQHHLLHAKPGSRRHRRTNRRTWKRSALRRG